MTSIAAIAALTAAQAIAIPTAPAPELGGAWALELTLVSAAKIPVLGNVNSTTVSIGHLRTLSSERGVVQRYEVCEVSLEDRGKLVTSSIPDAFVQALPVRTVTPTAVATDDGWSYRMDLGSTHVGYDPAISHGKPPSSAGDPAVIDSDGDGAPGATVVVSIPLFSDVDIHITQGTALSLHGTWATDGFVQGRADVAYLEQNVIGASNKLFARSPTIRPVNELSGFTLVRVPDDASCSELQGLVQAAKSPTPSVVAVR